MSNLNSIAIDFQEVNYHLKEKKIISELNLTINQGEILVILGRSGSGKTTILKLINSLLKPNQGDIIIEGKSINNWDKIQLRHHIGYVIQEIGLFPHFTVAENIGLIPSLQNWKSHRIKSRVYELLLMVGLPPEEFSDRYPQQLSGGQRQRIGVARALAVDPTIILMDEPFGALDPITRLDLQKELVNLHRNLGKTIVLVTHDIQEAFRVGSRIALMEAGKLVSLTTPTDFRNSSHPEAQSFIACLKDNIN